MVVVGDRESNLDVTGPSPVLQDFFFERKKNGHAKMLHSRGKLNKARERYFDIYVILSKVLGLWNHLTSSLDEMVHHKFIPIILF